MSTPNVEPAPTTTEPPAEEKFICHCGEWRFRNAHFVVDEIRKDVCRDLPFYAELEGKKYCVLHYPHVSKANDFRPVLQSRIDANDCDFRMVYFPEPLRYENQEFNTHADFGHATFAKEVSFKYCKFRAQFVFFDAHFLGDAYFTYSHFFDQANFNATDFQEHGGFAGVTFHEDSRPLFQGTKFKSGSFSSAEFHHEVEFTRAIFKDRVRFFDAKFFSKANFENVTLPQNTETEFRLAIFHESVNFGGVTFYETDFDHVKFSSSTFQNCKFIKSVSFVHAEFQAAVNFSKASFENVHFESATFWSQASFLECSFLEDVFFNDTKFGFSDEHPIAPSHVVFDGAAFGKDSRVFFDNTRFSWHTSFDYAKFDGYVFFKGTAENPIFATVFERHAHWSLLKILNATFDRPDKVYFQAVRLRPSWFVNVLPEVRKFNFTNIDWLDENGRFISIDGELRVIEKLTKHHSRRLLAIVFRQLADNADTNSRFEDASMFRRLSMETEWLEKKKRLRDLINGLEVGSDKLKARFGRETSGKHAEERQGGEETADIFGVIRRSDGFFIHLIYRVTSYYGESWAWALIMLLLIVLVFFPLIYTRTQFQVCPKEKPLPMSLAVCESKDEQVRRDCECVRGGLGFGEAVVHSLTTATLQNADYRKPTTKKGETVVILEKIFAPLQAALLALALRRKFMR